MMHTIPWCLLYININLLYDRHERSLALVNLQFSQQWDVGWALQAWPGGVAGVPPMPTRGLKIRGSPSAPQVS